MPGVIETVGPVVALVKDILLSVAAGVAVYVGLQGLSTWRRQLLGSVEHDVAKKILRSSYKLRDALDRFREPFILMGRHASGDCSDPMPVRERMLEPRVDLEGINPRSFA